MQAPRLRGIGKYLFNTIKHVAELRPDWEFVLFQDSRAERCDHFPSVGNIDTRAFAMKGDRFFLWEQLRLPFEILRSKVDVFHSPANTLPLIQVCPTIVTLHDMLLMDRDEDETRGFLWYTRRIIPIGARSARFIVTVSESSKRDIVDKIHVPWDRVEAIYHGVDPCFRKVRDLSLFESVSKRIGIRKKYIFCLGARAERKNTMRMLDVLESLKSKGFDIQLVLAGSQDDMLSLLRKAIVSRGLLNDVVLTGFVSDDELACLYSSAEVFVYPSFFEGFGFPIIEAMACGCPVVTSNVSSMPEILGDNAMLFDPGNTSSIVEKIALLLSSPGLGAEKAEKGIERAKLFQWKKSAEKMLAVYEKVGQGVEDHRRGRR